MSIRKKARHKHKNKPVRFLSPVIRQALEEVDEAIADGEFAEALELLEVLNRQFPNRPEILRETINFYAVQNDLSGVQKYGRKLVEITPNDADVWQNLAIAYLQNSRIALGVRALREFLKRFPNHEKAVSNREILSKAEEELAEMLTPFDFPPGDAGFDLACLHEEAQVLMEQGEYPLARTAAEKVIAQMPQFAAPRNNLSLIYFLDGQLEKAAETAQTVLCDHPENYHALANLAHYLDLLGQRDEAHQTAAKLLQVKSDKLDAAVKKAETLSYLRDDAAVVAVFREAQAQNILQERREPFIYHLAAAALCRLGDRAEAQKWWKEALQIDPHFELAQANLKELNLPVGESNAPFPFTMQYWVRGRSVEELARAARRIKKGKDEDRQLREVARQYFQKHPEMLRLLPILLERGDRTARDFAIMNASLTQTPETLRILKDFAFSQNGSDDLRYKAATELAELGEISKRARLWNQGEWREMKLLAFKITYEPMGERLPPKLEKLFQQALDAILDDNGPLAEQYLKKFLEIKPDHPSALYNLSKAYELQGRKTEALELIRQIHERFPDYSFAALTLARAALQKGKIEEAEKMIDPILERTEFHISEMRGLFPAQIELALARKQRDGAKQWLEMWAQVDDDFDYDYWDAKIKGDFSFLKRMLLGK